MVFKWLEKENDNNFSVFTLPKKNNLQKFECKNLITNFKIDKKKKKKCALCKDLIFFFLIREFLFKK